MDMKDKTIILTGAAGGIGRAITKKCLEQGAIVIACDYDNKKLEELDKHYESERLFTHNVDVSDRQKVVDLFDEIVNKFPGFNVLINNAGIYQGKSILDYTEEEVNRVTSVNIHGAVYFSQLFGKYLLSIKREGTIINISSVSGQEGSSDAVYGMTKSALIGLTKSLAMNLSPYIRVNAIAPAIVETEMLDSIPAWRLEEYRRLQRIKKPILPEDVANTTKFLITDESRNYTGSVFDLNNGCYLR